MGYFTIIRPLNCIITFISVLVGAWIGRGLVFPPALVLAGIIGFFVCAFGNVINDLHDIEIDKINNPKRPLPSGRVDKKHVTILAFILAGLSIFFSISLGLVPLLFIIGVLILLFYYANFLKKTPWGNLIVAVITGLSFVLGGLVEKNSLCIIPLVFSFFIHLPREIIKDIIDVKGDKSTGVVSIPMIWGIERSSTIIALLLGILCIILPMPFIVSVLGIRYIAIVLLLAYPIIIYTIVTLLREPQESELKRLSKLLKISMVIGLIAMII